MNFFKSKGKSPAELVKLSCEAFSSFNSSSKKIKCLEDLPKYLGQMKSILYGDGENEPNLESIAQLAQEFYNSDLLSLLIEHNRELDFESKKDVTQIFNNLLRRQIGTRTPTVEYICTRENILFSLLKGYEIPDVALNNGMMLRECIRHEPLAKILLSSPLFYGLFDYMEFANFDVASDAFASFKDLLTKHKTLSAEFMEENYEQFFEKYTKLLNSENYVTRRQSLRLLGEILLDRANFSVMTKYIGVPENLKLMMNLLRDKSKNIQFEAFHVFKVFVANPHKQKPILEILIKNQEKLIEFLQKFHNERADDEQFNDEKAYLLKQIQELPINNH